MPNCKNDNCTNKKHSTSTRRKKNSQHVFCLQTVLKLATVTSGGGNWILRDLAPPEAKAFDRKYSSCIRLWNTTMKNFRHHLENFISFPLIYRFAGIRRVLTELEADNWKHRSNYTVALTPTEGFISIWSKLSRHSHTHWCFALSFYSNTCTYNFSFQNVILSAAQLFFQPSFRTWEKDTINSPLVLLKST